MISRLSWESWCQYVIHAGLDPSTCHLFFLASHSRGGRGKRSHSRLKNQWFKIFYIEWIPADSDLSFSLWWYQPQGKKKRVYKESFINLAVMSRKVFVLVWLSSLHCGDDGKEFGAIFDMWKYCFYMWWLKLSITGLGCLCMPHICFCDFCVSSPLFVI